MKKKINLLITCVGGGLMPELLIHLKKSPKYDFKIIGTDKNYQTNSKHFCDKFYQTPDGSDEKKFIDKIKNIIENDKIDFVIPSADEEAVTLSKYKHKFIQTNCIVVIDDYSKLKIINNKLLTYKFLKSNITNNFYWGEVKTFNEMIKVINENKKNDSFVLKTPTDRGSRNIFYIKKKEYFNYEMQKLTEVSFKKIFQNLNKKNSLFLMELLKKPVFDIDLLCWDGKLLRIVQRKRVHSDYPNLGHEIINKKKISDYCHEIVKFLKLSGLYDIDIMMNSKNHPCLLEINPRKSGSLAISLKHGIEFIDDLIDLYYGKNISKGVLHKPSTIIPYTSLKKI